MDPKFTGQLRDTETNEDYFNARYLASHLGRFMSADPGNAGADLSNPQSWHGYGYVGGNVLSAVDPSGMEETYPLGNGCFSAEYSQPCIGIPIGLGGGGSGGGGAVGGGGGSVSAPPGSSTPLPPGSFPGGETLGLPPGVSVPNPLSPQVLLGLWGWDCGAGVCTPGFGNGFAFDPNQIENHHTLPKEFRPFFEAAQININRYLLPMTASAHRLVGGLHSKIGQYNPRWKIFFDENPHASREQIFDFAKKLLTELGVDASSLFPDVIIITNPCVTSYEMRRVCNGGGPNISPTQIY